MREQIKACDDALAYGFAADMQGEPSRIVISGIEQLDSDAADYISCMLELYRELKERNASARDFVLRIECNSRSATIK